MILLDSEQEAKDFVIKIGAQRASRILSAIGRRFDRRYNNACNASNSPVNPEWIYRTELEVNLTYKIKMGLQLTDDYNTPQAAKERTVKRLADRKAQRKARMGLAA